ncbi:MAG: hypothetical protein GXP37_07185 [Chloroflexi bacterium]|nr:hypothetical protein [Chloroflexota bacterium]
MNELAQRIRSLEAQITQLKQQWPQHSVPPTMLMELEGLEEALDEARRQRAADSKVKSGSK